jgi:hypothetical protein
MIDKGPGGPLARAYHLLQGIDLDSGRGPLLEFNVGSHPGDNTHYVRASGPFMTLRNQPGQLALRSPYWHRPCSGRTSCSTQLQIISPRPPIRYRCCTTGLWLSKSSSMSFSRSWFWQSGIGLGARFSSLPTPRAFDSIAGWRTVDAWASAAFYLLPFRVFELAIGCLLALPGMKFPRKSMLGGGEVSAGVALIVGGMVFVTEKWSFPGVALIPCTGTGLVIWGRMRSPPRHRVFWAQHHSGSSAKSRTRYTSCTGRLSFSGFVCSLSPIKLRFLLLGHWFRSSSATCPLRSSRRRPDKGRSCYLGGQSLPLPPGLWLLS